MEIDVFTLVRKQQCNEFFEYRQSSTTPNQLLKYIFGNKMLPNYVTSLKPILLNNEIDLLPLGLYLLAATKKENRKA